MLSIIVATDENNAIGKNNKLLWHISEDLKYFKSITSGHPVIMGRKTFESIGKPLPNRTNIVISRNIDLKIEGCIVANSLNEAINTASKINNEYFVIGGESIYKEAINIADTIYLTKVYNVYDADTYFPAIDNTWIETERQNFERGVSFEYPFSFIKYKRVL